MQQQNRQDIYRIGKGVLAVVLSAMLMVTIAAGRLEAVPATLPVAILKALKIVAPNVVCTVDTIADLRTVDRGGLIGSVQPLGYYAKGDGAGGPLRVWGSGAAPATYVDNGGSIIVPTGGDGSEAWLWLQNKETKARWWGCPATGGDTDDDTTCLMAALEAIGAGAIIDLEGYSYRVARHVGTDDHWGLKIVHDDVMLIGNGATMRRYNTDISTVSLAYPLIMVGTPDSNTADSTDNVTIRGIKFVGEDTRHTTDATALHDWRGAIDAKNSTNLSVYHNIFNAVDSYVVHYQRPVELNPVTGAHYNTTKNYDGKFVDNTVSAIPPNPVVPGRALIHAIRTFGCDGCSIDHNTFNWCDDAVTSVTSYNGMDSIEDDVYTPTVAGWALGAVKKSGMGTSVTRNTINNSSEHPIYLEGKDEVVSSNTIVNSNDTIGAGTAAIKMSSYGGTITSNVINGFGSGIIISAPARNVTASANSIVIRTSAAYSMGAITVDALNIGSYIADRSDYLTAYQPMSSIVAIGNSINFPDTAPDPADYTRHIALMVRTDATADANMPNGEMIGVTFSANTSKGHQVGFYVAGTQHRAISTTGNTFVGKPFNIDTFTVDTPMATRAAVQVDRANNSTTQLRQVRFSGNYVYGSTFLFASYDNLGTAGSISLPWGIQNNRFDYVKTIKNTDFAAVNSYNKFTQNNGQFFLDRSWSGDGIGNSLYDGTGSSELRYDYRYVSGQLRFYTDDAGTYIVVGP